MSSTLFADYLRERATAEGAEARDLAAAGSTTRPLPGLPAPPASAAASPGFAGFLRERAASHVPPATRGALMLADPAKADGFAKDRAVARRLGVPAMALEGPLREEWERQDALRQNLDALRDAPATQRFLADPENARLAADSVGELSFGERWWRSWEAAGSQDRRQRRITALERRAWIRNNLSDQEEEELRLLKGVETPDFALDEEPVPDWIRELREGQTPVRGLGIALEGFFLGGRKLAEAPIAARATLGSTLEGLMGSAAGGLGGGGLALLAGVPVAREVAIGALVGGIVTSGASEGAAAFDAMRGRGVAEDVARAAAAPVALVSGAVEVGALAAIPGVRQLVRGQLLAATTRPLLQRVLMDVAASGLGEGAEEGVQELAQSGGQWIADVIEGRDTNVTFETEVDGERVVLTGWDALLARAAVAAEYGALAGLAFGGVFGGVQAGATVLARAGEAQRAKRFGEQLERLRAGIEGSKLAERAPDVLQAHAREVIAEQGGPAHVYIAPDRLVTLLQSASPEILEEAQAAVPDLARRAGEALAAGTDLQLPADALPRLLRTPVGAELAKDVRAEPGAMTAREAEEAQPELEAEIRALLDQGDREAAAGDAIDTYLARLETELAPAFGEEIAAHNVALWRALLRSISAQHGLTPEEALEVTGQMKVEVEAPVRRRLADVVPLVAAGAPAVGPGAGAAPGGVAPAPVEASERNFLGTLTDQGRQHVGMLWSEDGQLIVRNPDGSEAGPVIGRLEAGEVRELQPVGGTRAFTMNAGAALRPAEASGAAVASEPAAIDRPATTALLEAIRTGRRPEQEGMPKRPLLYLLNRLGGVQRDSELAGELRNMGVTGKTMPGLFRAKGLTALDNLSRSEERLLMGLPATQGTDYADPRAMLDAIAAEMKGRPLRTDAQAGAIAEAELQRESLVAELDRLGLDVAASDEELLDAIEAEVRRQQAEPREAFHVEQGERPFEFMQSAPRDEALIGAAVAEFGVTGDPREAGFVLPDGRMLNLSEPGQEGTRSQDHTAVARLRAVRELVLALGRDAFGEQVGHPVVEFQNATGAIRVDFASGLVDSQTGITSAQARVIASAANELGVTLVVEAHDAEGGDINHALVHRPSAAVLQRFFGDPTRSPREFFQSAPPVGSAVRTFYQPGQQQGLFAGEAELTGDEQRVLELLRTAGDRPLAALATALSITPDRFVAAAEGLADAGLSELVASPYSQDPQARSIRLTALGRQRLGLDRATGGGQGSLFQGPTEEDPPRGSASFDMDLRQIRVNLLASRDLSTFLHEGGHVWLPIVRKLALREGASERAIRDWSLVKDKLGIVSDDAAITGEQHERFARMAEGYLMEGKAPSLELRDLFSRFLVWLTAIYRGLRPGAGDLSDEIRGVFDRLLATDEQIAALEASQEVTPLTEELQKDLMSPEERARYDAAVREAHLAIREKLTAAALSEVRAQQREDYAAATAQIEQDVRLETDLRRDMRARHWLVTGQWIGAEEDAPTVPHAKLDTAALRAMEGQRAERFPTGMHGWAAKGGIHPDQAAEQLGFDTGAELVAAIQGLPTREKFIEQEVKHRLRERFGDRATAANEAASVLAEIPKVAEFVLMEELALARRVGKTQTPVAILRSTAGTIIGLQPVMDLAPHKYRAAATRAARTAAKALAAGDFETARSAKRQQALNLILEKMARDAREEADKNGDFYARVMKPTGSIWKKLGKAGHNYQEQVAHILGRFKLGDVSNRQIRRRQSLEAWIRKEMEAGEIVAIPDLMRNEAFRKHWRELTVKEMRMLREAVDAIVHLATAKVDYLIGKERRENGEIREELALEAEANVEGPEPRKPGELGRAELTEFEKLKAKVTSMLVEHEKVEAIADRLDGARPRGAWKRYVIEPLAQAQHRYNDLRKAALAPMAKSLSELVRGHEMEYGTFRRIEELGIDGSRFYLLMIALNSGNAGNREKLLAGSALMKDTKLRPLLSAPWSEQQLEAAHKLLTRAEWEWIQSVWDLFERVGKEALEEEFQLTGVRPPKVEAVPFEVLTSDGHRITMRGGYFPVVYDPRSSQFAYVNVAKGVYEGIETAAFRPVTEHGYTIARTGAIGPILLDLRVIPQHLDEVLLDMTHRRTITAIDRLLYGHAAGDLYDSVVPRIGPDAYQQFRYALSAIAGDGQANRDALTGMDPLFRYVRTRSTVFALSLRASTHLVQLTGHAPAVEWLRERLPSWQTHYVAAARAVAAHPFVQADAVRALSGEMRHRIHNLERDFRDIAREAPLRKASVGVKGAIEEIVGPARELERVAMQSSLQTIGLMQFYGVDLPLWLAAWNGAQRELGMDEAAAIEFADSTVRLTQGAGGLKDLSKIQRGSELQKMLTQFYSYLNTIAQRVLAIHRSDANVAEKTYRYFLVLSIPATIANLVGIALGPRELPDLGDDDGWDELEFVLASGGLYDLLSMIVPLRIVTPAIRRALGGQGGGRGELPIQRLGATLEDAIRVSENEDAKDWFFDVLRFLGALRGIPPDEVISRAEQATEALERD